MASNIAKVDKRFSCPGPQPNGIQAAPDGLWVIDQVDNKVYKLDYETGETLFAAQTDTVHSSGITVGDGYLWIASTYELKIAKLELDNRPHRRQIRLARCRHHSAPGGYRRRAHHRFPRLGVEKRQAIRGHAAFPNDPRHGPRLLERRTSISHPRFSQPRHRLGTRRQAVGGRHLGRCC